MRWWPTLVAGRVMMDGGAEQVCARRRRWAGAGDHFAERAAVETAEQVGQSLIPALAGQCHQATLRLALVASVT